MGELQSTLPSPTRHSILTNLTVQERKQKARKYWEITCVYFQYLLNRAKPFKEIRFHFIWNVCMEKHIQTWCSISHLEENKNDFEKLHYFQESNRLCLSAKTSCAICTIRLNRAKIFLARIVPLPCLHPFKMVLIAVESEMECFWLYSHTRALSVYFNSSSLKCN